MKAKNILTFVEPFEVGEQTEHSEQSAEALRFFLTLCTELISQDAATVRQEDFLQGVGIVTVRELSLRADFDDGTYLHVTPYTLTDEGGLIDIGVNIVSHREDDTYDVGYSYVTGDNYDVLRSTMRSYNETEDDPDDMHFSMIGVFRYAQLMKEKQIFGTDSEVQEATEVLEEIYSDIEFDKTVSELGYDNQPVTLRELETLAVVLQDLRPFPIKALDEQ